VSLTSHQDVFEGTYGGWWWVVVCGVVVYAWIVKREGKTVLSCFESWMAKQKFFGNPHKSLTCYFWNPTGRICLNE
jgi:hypothetical protein